MIIKHDVDLSVLSDIEYDTIVFNVLHHDYQSRCRFVKSVFSDIEYHTIALNTLDYDCQTRNATNL